MMEQKEYSAGMVKLSFWFNEFRKVVNLLNAGKTWEEIKKLSVEENLFGAPTEARGLQIFTTTASRVKNLDDSFYTLFEECDIANQKLIVLISIMKTDSLFFDFIHDVFREKLIIGDHQLADSDIRVFFKNKQIQSEKVAKWKDYTLKRLGSCYKTLLMESGLINQESGNREILKPLMDITLENHLKISGMDPYLRALTGVR